jgi:hypothetical protein
MNAAERRLYRLWRTSAILCLVGAAEFLALAWQRGAWPIAIVAAPLLAVALFATRRAARLRHLTDHPGTAP